jgi:hypothetical protein
MTEEIQNKIILLNDEGLSPSKIAQKVRVKKAVVLDILGTNVNGGVGSTIEAITAATGLDKLADKAAKAVGLEDCGCKARAATLNEIFPYRTMNDLSTEDYDFLDDWFTNPRNSVKANEQADLVAIYNRVFSAKRKTSTCGQCVASMVRDLKKVYEGSNDQ